MSLRRRKRTSKAILEIIDADGTFDLIPWLMDWTPARASTKGGGVWQSGVFSDGRVPVMLNRDNVVDTFELAPWDYSMDTAIAQLQTLSRKLESARNYWTGVEDTPVYIRARGSQETNIRYAVILDYAIPQDDNPFAQPFFNAPTNVMQDFSLIVEHGLWQTDVPTSATCLEVNNLESNPTGNTNTTFQPLVSADDGYIDLGWRASVDTGGNNITMGYNVNPFGGAVRFRSVTIPQGATINSAIIGFDSIGDYSTTARLRIYIQESTNPAILSDYADFITRTFKSNPTVGWIPGAWTTGNQFFTPDISELLQWLVDRPTWSSGNSLLIYIKDDPSNPSAHPGYRDAASWDNVGLDGPQLFVTYSSTTHDYGRSATCENEVYVTSRHTHNQIDTVKFYDDSGASYTSRTIGGTLPYDITPVVPEDDDIIYFGISTPVPNAGPFCGLVFCLTSAMTGVTDAEWQYYSSGTGWTTIDTVCDNTSGTTGGGLPLQIGSGVGIVSSVHWEQPDDWTTVAINGVTAWYVRVYVTTGGAGGKKVTQALREVYALTTPYVDIPAAQITGDLPALAHIKMHTQSANDLYANDLYLTNIMVALRSYSRGANYTPYINMSDNHNPSGILIVEQSGTITADSQSPSGYSLQYTPAGAESNTYIGYVSMSADISEEYKGRFRAFLVARQVGGAAGDISVRMSVYTGVYIRSDEVPTNMHDEFDVLDMGMVNIPVETSYLRFYIDITNTNASPPDIVIYELVLVPIDEWSGQFYRDVYHSWNAHYFDADSATEPKKTISVAIRNNDDDSVYVPLLYRASGEIILQPNTHQRLWFFMLGGYQLGDYYRPYPEVSISVEIEAVRRYLSMRGDG